MPSLSQLQAEADARAAARAEAAAENYCRTRKSATLANLAGHLVGVFGAFDYDAAKTLWAKYRHLRPTQPTGARSVRLRR